MEGPFLLRILINNRLLGHLFFWILSFTVLLQWFATSEKLEKLDLIYTSLFHLSIGAGVYLNLLFLIPVFLSKARWGLYLGLLLLLLMGMVLLHLFTFDYLVDRIFPGYYFISYYEPVDILKFMSSYLAITTLLYFSKSWFLLAETQRQYEALRQEKRDAELQALKSQINPHFLFNTLNSIYAMTLSGSEKSSEMVLRLSDMMRYVIYEASSDRVLLEREIACVNDYVVLQQIRSGTKATITLQVSGDAGQKEVAPLLLLPLVENAFKHGVMQTTGNSYVSIYIVITDRNLRFVIENTIQKREEQASDGCGGIGLANVQKRLEQIYPGSHRFTIFASGEHFRVELEIPAEQTDKM